MKMNKRIFSGCMLLAAGCLYLIGCGESSGGGTKFSQSDLVGSWYFLQFASGPGVTAGTTPGWMRGTVTVDTQGNLTFDTFSSSDGSTTPPSPRTITDTIDATGVVTESGSNATSDYHAVMSNNKQIAVGTGSEDTDRLMRICVKQDPNVTFSDADITGPKSLVFHQLFSGMDNIWSYGAGTIDSSRQLTISSLYFPSGPESPPAGNFDTLSITNQGIVTSTYNATSEGIMTPDKKMIFSIGNGGSNNNNYTLLISQFTGQTFTQADAAGTFRSHTLYTSDTTPMWSYDTFVVDSDGILTDKAHQDSFGGNTPLSSTSTIILDSSGNTTISGSDFNGYISYNKDKSAFTSSYITSYTGQQILLYHLGISLRQ